MDIRSLRHLLAVLETGSLNKAAVQVGVSQPALSKAIQRLEAEIGAPLFEREAKGVRPTLYGSRLIEFARATCVAFDQSMAEIKDIKTGSSGAVTLYAPPLIASHLFPEIFLSVNRKFPDLRLRFEVQIDHLVDTLLDGKADLVIGTITPDILKQGFQCLALFEEDLVVICRSGHPITRLRSVTAKSLSQFGWVFSAPGNLHRKRLERFFEMGGVPLPRPVAETSAPALIRSLVISSNLIALMAGMGVKDDPTEALDYVRIRSPLMVRSIGLLWRADYPLPTATKNVIATIRDICERRQTPKRGSQESSRQANVGHFVV